MKVNISYSTTGIEGIGIEAKCNLMVGHATVIWDIKFVLALCQIICIITLNF